MKKQSESKAMRYANIVPSKYLISSLVYWKIWDGENWDRVKSFLFLLGTSRFLGKLAWHYDDSVGNAVNQAFERRL